MFEKNMKFPILLDIYGSLLTERKREILEYYYNEDYSLSEISEITGISRQGVRDSIKKSEEEIYSMEEKLALAEKTECAMSAAEIAAELSEYIKSDGFCVDSLMDKLNEIRSLLAIFNSARDAGDTTETDALFPL